MQVDALTISPYLGFGSTEPILSRVAEANAYVFVVVRSSNPEGSAIQMAGQPEVWASLLDDIANWSARNGCKTVGAVIGATEPKDLKFATDRLPEAFFLAPGIGKQGATVSDLRELEVPLHRVIVSSSRGVAENGPDPRWLKDAVTALAKSSEGYGRGCSWASRLVGGGGVAVLNQGKLAPSGHNPPVLSIICSPSCLGLLNRRPILLSCPVE